MNSERMAPKRIYARIPSHTVPPEKGYPQKKQNGHWSEKGRGNADDEGGNGFIVLISSLTNTMVRLLVGCTVDPINPGFKVVMLAFQKV